MQLSEIAADQLDREAGCVGRIYVGEQLGVLVRGFVSAIEAGEAVAAIGEDAPRIPIATDSATHTIGRMLAPTMLLPHGPTLEQYLSSRATWSCLDLFSWDFGARLRRAFEQLSGSPAEVPSGPDGRPYAAATLHVFPPGSGAPRHRDHYAQLPCQEQLRTITDASTQLSWFLVLSPPARGGELAIYLDEATTLHHQPRIGDLLLFDGGRYDHEVLPSDGSARITLGGFARRSTTATRLFFWG